MSRRDYDDEDGDRRRYDEEPDDRPRPKKSKFPVWVILLIVFGVGLVACVPIMIALLLPAVQKTREAAARARSTNNLKQIALGAHAYHSSYTYFPLPYVRTPDGSPPPADPNRRLSWRVSLLPYIEQDPLYKSFQLGEAWDSPANRRFSDTIIPTYLDPRDQPAPQTRYRVFVGGGAIFDPDKPITMAAIPDGTANTIMFVEAADTVPWAQYNELPFDPNGPLPRLGRPDGRGFLVGFADGSVRFLSNKVDPQVLKNAIGRAEGVPLPPGWDAP